MRKVLIATIIITYFMVTSLAMGEIRRTTAYKTEFKRALDAATDAAINHRTYAQSESLEGLAFGYGTGYENKANITIYKEDALEWFYKVFYKNIGIDNNLPEQEKTKKYLVMKCLVLFDRLEIANANDQWILNKQYSIEFRGEKYLFTLSDDVQKISTGEWLDASSIGIEATECRRLVTTFITDEINQFLYEHGNRDTRFSINIGTDNNDPMLSGINGINFIVFVDKMPLSGFNIFNPKEKFMVFSIGGSELYRD